MNKTAIKNYAVWARVQLIESAKQRAYEYGITEKSENDPYANAISGRLLTAEEKNQRRELIEEIGQKGFDQVMEEAAYTWFNRFAALRFMEVNGYLPSKVRVFTDENGAFKPDVLKEAMTVEIEGLEREKVLDLLDKQNNEELYKYLLITQCNALNEGLPYMFEKIANWTELLFPKNLLHADSIIDKMVNDIPEEDWLDAVQIIGWLYQYYNSELKDDTFAQLKKNVKISKERIPAATQLFTPDWIVRYMVENSLGRLWVEGHPDDELKANWKYYLEEAEQEEEVKAQLEKIRAEYANLNPEDIKVIDPCMGSGHILVYAFDVLMQIYESIGYSQRDAAQLILKNNIYGLDIDNRAAQLSYFAVMMKARQYDRRIFTRDIEPNVFEIEESNSINRAHIKFFGNGLSTAEKLDAQNRLNVVLNTMHDAKEYGSILDVKNQDWDLLEKFVSDIEDAPMSFETVGIEKTQQKLLQLIKVAKVMAQKYHTVVTNPPYMAVANAGPKVVNYVKKYFPDSKADMFAVFIERCGKMLKSRAFQAMITQHSWMFLSDFKKLRPKILQNNIVNMIHLGARAFEEISGEVVQTTSFVIRKDAIKKYTSTYKRLVDGVTATDKEEMFFDNKNICFSSSDSFEKIPDNIFAYWLSKNVLKILEKEKKLSMFGNAKQGLATTDNKLFLRLWPEIDASRIDFNCKSCNEIEDRKTKWFPYNKAGTFRKWSSIDEYVVNYENNGFEIKNSVMRKYPYLNNPGFVVKNTETYFKHGITWNDVSTGNFCCRYIPDGYIYDAAGPMFFSNNDFIYMAYFNSKVFQIFADIICQGLHYSTGHIPLIPFIDPQKDEDRIRILATSSHKISKEDWDSFETSWDFKKHPLV